MNDSASELPRQGSRALRIRNYGGVLALISAAVLPGMIVPVAVGALTMETPGKAAMSATAAGAVAAMTLLGFALGSVGLAGRIGTRQGTLSALAAGALQGTCVIAAGAFAIGALQVTAGILAGAAAAAGLRALSRVHNAQRVTGAIYVSSTIVSSVVIIALTSMLQQPNRSQLFPIVGAVMAALAVLSLLADRVSGEWTPPLSRRAAIPVTGFLAAGGLLAGSDGALFSFTAPVITAHGFDPATTGYLSAASSILGIVAAIAVTRASSSRLMLLLIATLFLKAASTAALPWLGALPTFVSSFLLASISYFVISTGLTGLAAGIDASGRLAGRTVGVMAFGAAAGPAVAGYLVKIGGTDAVCLGSGIGCAMAVLLLWPTAARSLAHRH